MDSSFYAQCVDTTCKQGGKANERESKPSKESTEKSLVTTCKQLHKVVKIQACSCYFLCSGHLIVEFD